MIITSYLDDNYYVLENNILKLYVLLIIMQNNYNINGGEIIEEDISERIIMEYISKLSIPEFNKKLFVPKKSILGKKLTNLIAKNQICDNCNVISEEKVELAFINAIQSRENEDYINILKDLKANQRYGKIDDLKEIYPYDILKKIGLSGTKQNYLEEEGLLYQDDKLYLFNIVNKIYIPLEQKIKSKTLTKSSKEDKY